MVFCLIQVTSSNRTNGDGNIRLAISQSSDCSQLRSPYNGPLKLVLKKFKESDYCGVNEEFQGLWYSYAYGNNGSSDIRSKTWDIKQGQKYTQNVCISMKEQQTSSGRQATILYKSFGQSQECFFCAEFTSRTKHVLQVRKGNCITHVQGETLTVDVCNSAELETAENQTMFAFPNYCRDDHRVTKDCYADQYCNNAKEAKWTCAETCGFCPTVNGHYYDAVSCLGTFNRTDGDDPSRMKFFCPNATTSHKDDEYHFQCLGSWTEVINGTDRTMAALINIDEKAEPRLRFRCIMTEKNQNESTWIMSTNASCSFPNFAGDKSVKLVLMNNHGQTIKSTTELQNGPRFTDQSENLIIFPSTERVVLECKAHGSTLPTSKWFMLSNSSDPNKIRQPVEPTFDNLVINDVSERYVGKYQCLAENKFGAVFSNPIEIRFGYLGDFPEDSPAPVRALAYQGAVIECPSIRYEPDVEFAWWMQRSPHGPLYYLRGSSVQFVSQNGRLYFPEVTLADDATYSCMATLRVSSDISFKGNLPSKISKAIRLNVLDAATREDWGPIIPDEFIEVFPPQPRVGQDVRLECFAYGSGQGNTGRWSYTWTRDDKGMPDNVVFEDSWRVMNIRNITQEDKGVYRCTVRRDYANATRTVNINVDAAEKPYFTTQLNDQYITQGDQLTWRCDAGGHPDPTYHWYKNGKLLTSSSDGQLTVTGNTLVIQSMDANSHPGMYQCSASNDHGTVYSSAQLRNPCNIQ